MEYSTLNKKKIQRKVNKIVKKLNKNIENDELWKGRFYIRQVRRYMKNYEDGSGVDANFLFEMIDKQTGLRDYSGWHTYFGLKTFNKIAFDMNNFIVDKVKVWDEKPTPETTIDYRLKRKNKNG